MFVKGLRLAAICVLLVPLARSATAATVTLDQDTIIDSGSSFPDDSLVIVDGSLGPSRVTLLSGGTVGVASSSAGNVRVTQNSSFEMLGGFVANRVTAIGNATFIYRGGDIGSFGDATSFIDISDAATLNFYGIPASGVVALGDFSTANFYGRNLTLTGTTISGTLSNGEPVAGDLAIFGPNVSIVLHQIPEPQSLILALVLGGVSAACRRFR